MVSLPSLSTVALFIAGLLLLRFLHLLIFSDCDLTTCFLSSNPAYFRGKVAWITGASSGIGLALAKRLAREGTLLILTSRRGDLLEEIADSLPCPRSNVHVLPLNLAEDPSVLEETACSVQEVYGRLDFLFNNAGVTTRVTAMDLDLEQVAGVMQLNFIAPVTLTRACLPALKEAPGGKGTVVNTLSIAALVSTPLRSSYSASKAALAAYCECLQLEERDVRVVNIFPGSVRTPIEYNAIGPGGRKIGKTSANIEAGLEPARAVDRILAAVAVGLPSSWIARPVELWGARCSQAFPMLWSRIAPSILGQGKYHEGS